MFLFCQVKHSTACETQTRPDCKTIQWQACRYVLHCKYSLGHINLWKRKTTLMKSQHWLTFNFFSDPPPMCTLCDSIQSKLGRKIDFLFGLTTVKWNYFKSFLKGIIKNNKLSLDYKAFMRGACRLGKCTSAFFDN